MVLETLFSYMLPQLHDHMQDLGVSISQFTVSWFLCLFSEAPLALRTPDAVGLLAG